MADDVVRLILNAAADILEGRDDDPRWWNAGPQIYSVVWRALYEVVGHPAVEAVRRAAGVEQVQRWTTDKDTAVKTLRAAAGTLDLFEAQQLDAVRRIEAARIELLAVLGYQENGDYTFGQALADVGDRLRQAQFRIEALERENAALRKQQHEAA